MTRGKLGAIAVIGCVFAAQLFALSPAGRGGWYWPFVDYPMYSEAKMPGATFGLFDLEAVDCSSGVRELSVSDLKLPPFRYRNALALAAGNMPQRPDRPRDPQEVEEARKWVGELIATHVPGDWCEARIQGRIFRMNESGLESTEVPRQLLAAWPIGPEQHR